MVQSILCLKGFVHDALLFNYNNNNSSFVTDSWSISQTQS